MDDLIQKLKDEGYMHVYSWTDAPDAYYSDHSHSGKTAQIILDGEIEITIDNKKIIYKEGDRVDVDANVVHSAKIGPQGCTYLIGE